MMNKLKLFTLLLLFAGTFLACGSRKSVQKDIHDDFLVSVKHVGCRGTCPDYYYTVDSKGHVVYEGRHAVDRMGVWEKDVAMDNVVQMDMLMKQYDFCSFDREYGMDVADLPYVVITYRNDGRGNEVKYMKEAPVKLIELEKELMSVIGEDGFTKVEG